MTSPIEVLRIDSGEAIHARGMRRVTHTSRGRIARSNCRPDPLRGKEMPAASRSDRFRIAIFLATMIESTTSGDVSIAANNVWCFTWRKRAVVSQASQQAQGEGAALSSPGEFASTVDSDTWTARPINRAYPSCVGASRPRARHERHSR